MAYKINIFTSLKKKLIESNTLVIKIIGGVVVFIVIVTCILFGYNQFNKSNIAIQALNDMYNFTDYYNLQTNNMKELENITTPRVFNFLKFGSYNATANYMQMKNTSTRVNILKVTNDYITFSLSNKNINNAATYIMFYKVNIFGKLEEVHQSEIFSTLNIAASN